MADGKHVFISYGAADREQALALKSRIEAEGHAVWIDQKGLAAGEPYHADIAQAITDAYAAVVIWSSEAVQSLWVYAEAQRAKGQRKIVPVRIEPASGDRLVIPLPFDALHTIRYERTADILAAIGKRRLNLPLEPAENRSADDIARDIVDPRHSPLPPDAVDTSPTTLLHARHALVTFDDETGALAELIEWATGRSAWVRGPRVALGRLIHGPGGLGKTRLVVEACRRLFDRGWIAGFVPHEVLRQRDRFDELRRILMKRRDCNGVLIAVDYVEALAKDEIAKLAAAVLEAAAVPGPPIRLVLLSRAAGDWWTSLVNTDEALQRLTAREGGSDAIALAPIGQGRADRVALFDAAWQEFDAEIRAFETRYACSLRETGDVDLDAIERVLRDPDDPTFDRPLFIHIAALLAAYGDARTSLAHGVPGLLDGILGLEHGRWDRALKLEPQTNKREAIHRAAAQVTAVGKLPGAADVDALVAADPFYAKVADTDAVQTARAICQMLPGQGAEVEGVQPDLVGEHHVLDRMTVELLEACLVWAGDDEARRVALLTVLQRATRAEHGAKAARAVDLIDHVIRRHAVSLAPALMQVMETTPGRAQDRVDALLDTLPPDAVALLSFALPRFNTGWLDFSVRVSERHVATARDAASAIGALDAPSPDTAQVEALQLHSGALNNLSVRLSEAGRPADALPVTQEAVDIYRRLAAAAPARFEPDLATSLSNLGIWLGEVGRPADALPVTQEAVDLYRRLAAAAPARFEPDLATSLSNLGISLSEVGRPADALPATQEALDLYRRLAAAAPARFEPDLARSLSNLGAEYSAVGRPADALPVTQEALDLYRRLAAAAPARFEPDLATSLSNLGAEYSAVGCPAEALAVTEEAVAIRRRLAAAAPARFEPGLARTISVLSGIHAALDRHADAAQAAHEALRVLLPHLERLPRAHAGLARLICKDIVTNSGTAGIEPDRDLLARAAAAIQAAEADGDGGTG